MGRERQFYKLNKNMSVITLHGIYLTLKKWSNNPNLPRKEVSVFSYDKEGKKADIPFTEAEIKRMKDELLRHKRKK